MDSLQLQALIRKSTLITSDERAYWLKTLPTMKPEHAARLEKILGEGETIRVEEKVQEYFTAVKQVSQSPLAT